MRWEGADQTGTIADHNDRRYNIQSDLQLQLTSYFKFIRPCFKITKRTVGSRSYFSHANAQDEKVTSARRVLSLLLNLKR